MKVLVVCLLLCSCSLADKEYYDDDTFSQLTEDLMKEIRKRISEDPVEPASTGECEHDYGLTTATDAIIKTRDSIEKGAEFIKSPVVTARSECLQMCCDEDNCNVAVFKDEGVEHSCYLFDCGSLGTCLFTNHTGFTVLQLPHKRTAKVQGMNHEEDLVKLADVSTSPPTTTTTTTTTTKQPETTKNEKPVPLFGECNHDKDCAGSRTVCQVNYCVCQDDYHAQDGECKAPKSTVDTVQDNSDEHEGGWDDNDSQYKHEHPDEDSEQESEDSDVAVPTEKPEPVERPGGGDGDSAEKAAAREQEEAKNQDVDTPQEPQEQGEPEQEGSSEQGDQADKGVADKRVGTPLVKQPHVEVLNDGAQVSGQEQEKEAEEQAVAQSNQGAVIALALGLSITALLLVFVGCRLRSVKRRLRRGRPLNSNEADYLVNGMYL